MQPSAVNFSFAFDNPKASDRVLELVGPVAHPEAPPSNTRRRGTKRKAALSLDEEEETAEGSPVFKKLHVSTAILGGHSSFFQSMLCGDMKEAKETTVQIQVGTFVA